MMEHGLRAVRSIPKIRKKIEQLQIAFEMAAGITASEMEKIVIAHLKSLKFDMLKSIAIKLSEVEKNAKKRILDHFNVKSTEDLLDPYGINTI